MVSSLSSQLKKNCLNRTVSLPAGMIQIFSCHRHTKEQVHALMGNQDGKNMFLAGVILHATYLSIWSVILVLDELVCRFYCCIPFFLICIPPCGVIQWLETKKKSISDRPAPTNDHHCLLLDSIILTQHIFHENKILSLKFWFCPTESLKLKINWKLKKQ